MLAKGLTCSSGEILSTHVEYNLDADSCAFSNTGSYDWTRNSGETTTRSQYNTDTAGPNADHTTGLSQDLGPTCIQKHRVRTATPPLLHWGYGPSVASNIHASAENLHLVCSFLLQTFTTNAGSFGAIFWYNMHGIQIGTPTASIFTECSWSEVFS